MIMIIRNLLRRRCHPRGREGGCPREEARHGDSCELSGATGLSQSENKKEENTNCPRPDSEGGRIRLVFGSWPPAGQRKVSLKSNKYK